jgi:hypothetical protein
MSWRDSARPIIAKVLAENEGKSEKEIRKALREAYPFGVRQYHPYKIWCDEVKRQWSYLKSRKDLSERWAAHVAKFKSE